MNSTVRRFKHGVAGLVALAVCPSVVSAQFEGYLKDITDIAFFVSCWDAGGPIETKDKCLRGFHGFGVEVMYRLAPVSLEILGGSKTTSSVCVPTEVEVTRGVRTTSCSMTEKTSLVGPYVLFELALGYSQFNGFSAQDTAVELRGTVRELPALSLYATVQNDDPASLLRRLQPYIGVRTGLIQLHNTQLYSTPRNVDGAVHTASAQSFQLGAIAGLAVRAGPHLSPFIEVGRTRRKFQSVQWSLVNNAVPGRAPRELDYSGWSWAGGVQVRLR